MYAVARLSSYISRGVYTVSGPFHPFGGAVDIIVVQQPDGSFKSSPWYVKFGKFQGVLKTKEKIVKINVNGVEADFHMYLDHKGEAYFLSEVDGDEGLGELVYSPPSSGDETDEQSQIERSISNESKSGDFDADGMISVRQIDVGNGKIITRTNSRRSRIFGLVFGRKSTQEGSEKGVERLSSLESAEIAADLLEMKWSTNLSNDEPRRNNASRLSDSNTQAGELEMELLNENSFDHPVLHEATALCEGELGEIYANTQCLGLITTEEFDCLKTDNQDIEVSKLEATDVYPTQEGPLNASFHVTAEVSADSILPDVQSLNLAEVGVKSCLQSDIKPGCNESSVHEEENQMERVSSYIYCETSERSRVGDHYSTEHTLGSLSSSHGGLEEVQYEVEELIPKVNFGPETGALMTNTYINNTGLFSDENSCEFPSTDDIRARNGTPMNSVLKSSNMESHSSIDISESIEAESLQVIQPDTVSTRLTDGKMEAEPVETFGNQSRIQPSVALRYQTIRSMAHQSLGSVKDKDSQVVSTSSSLSNAVHQDREEETNGEENMTNKLHSSLDFTVYPQGSDIGNLTTEVSNSSIPLSESMVEDQFVFDDIDQLESSRFQSKESILSDNMAMEDHFLASMSQFENEQELNDKNHECSLSSNNLVGECPSVTSASLLEQSTTKSNPLSIPKSQNWPVEECLMIESLPIIRSHIDNLETPDVLHPLSCSVDSSSKTLSWPLFTKEGSMSLKLDSDHNFLKEQPTIGDTWNSKEPSAPGMTSFDHEQNFEPEGMIAMDRVDETLKRSSPRAIVAPGGSWRLWPFSFRRSRTMGSVYPGLDDIKVSDTENASESSTYMSEDKNMHKDTITKKKVKSIVPTSEQLASLNLKEGQNVIKFTFSTAMLGKQQVDARIYLWKWNARIVVSDVDGTITKSDVLGQFMPLVGKDWSQTGVAHLFSAIEENGYQLLFLSARAISQAYLTRQFLFSLKQDGKALPDGPVVISPDGLFPSLFREVIRRAPHEFKIACLEDIRALFPPDCNPFYAGFGNRDTDEISYVKVGIPKGKIFIINPKGQVAVNHRVDLKSYTSIHALVNGMFPAMNSIGQEEFNSWNYWKMPLPEIDI